MSIWEQFYTHTYPQCALLWPKSTHRELREELRLGLDLDERGGPSVSNPVR
jgi:hypothetical protein